jgi:transcriptional regulator with XRE-family HTH domain
MSSPEEKFYRLLGNLISEKRTAAKKSQEGLASLVGLKRTSITNIEAGRQNIQVFTLYRIAAALDIPVNILLPGIEGNPPDLSSLLRSQKILTASGESTVLDKEEQERVLKVLKENN